MAVVTHTTLRGCKVGTRFGEIELDAGGQAKVEDDVAQQLVDLYGTSFVVPGLKKTQPKSESRKPTEPPRKKKIAKKTTGKTGTKKKATKKKTSRS